MEMELVRGANHRLQSGWPISISQENSGDSNHTQTGWVVYTVTHIATVGERSGGLPPLQPAHPPPWRRERVSLVLSLAMFPTWTRDFSRLIFFFKMPLKFCTCVHIQKRPSSKLATRVPWIWQCLLLVAVGIVKNHEVPSKQSPAVCVSSRAIPSSLYSESWLTLNFF